MFILFLLKLLELKIFENSFKFFKRKTELLILILFFKLKEMSFEYMKYIVP